MQLPCRDVIPNVDQKLKRNVPVIRNSKYAPHWLTLDTKTALKVTLLVRKQTQSWFRHYRASPKLMQFLFFIKMLTSCWFVHFIRKKTRTISVRRRWGLISPQNQSANCKINRKVTFLWKTKAAWVMVMLYSVWINFVCVSLRTKRVTLRAVLVCNASQWGAYFELILSNHWNISF